MHSLMLSSAISPYPFPNFLVQCKYCIINEFIPSEINVKYFPQSEANFLSSSYGLSPGERTNKMGYSGTDSTYVS